MDELARALEEVGQGDLLKDATSLRFDDELAEYAAAAPDDAELARLSLIGFVNYRSALNHYLTDAAQSKASFSTAYVAFRGILAARKPEVLNANLSVDGLLSAQAALCLHLSVAGLCSDHIAEARHDLMAVSLPRPDGYAQWDHVVASAISGALVRLIRKGHAWQDIDEATQIIAELREAQANYESGFLDVAGSDFQAALSAYDLVGLYNLAQMCVVAAEYIYGTPQLGRAAALNHIRRHHDNAIMAFRQRNAAGLQMFASVVRVATEALVANSLWSHVDLLGERSRDYAKALVARSRAYPILELWPGQQKALRENLLDPYRKAIVVQMPTSGGKTLLAKFAILQAKSLNPNGSVSYLVPSRALVNQVTNDLRSDFAMLDQPLSVEQALPVFELDPTEDRLLQAAPDVLVTTPEKLDLLVRRNHPAVQNISLVIVDEAHNIADRTRGARLELLLGTLKRERANARFLLLSPFFPNPGEVASWLSDGGSTATISVDWRPTPRIVGLLRFRGRAPNRHLALVTVGSVDTIDLEPGREIALGQFSDDRPTIENYTSAAVTSLRSRGSILVLCAGPGTTVTRATSLAETRGQQELDAHSSSLLKFLALELGESSPLIGCISRGVAFHHAGLSGETKQIVEYYLREGVVDTVCGTTTLAEGVNFPIKTVIFESTAQRRRSLPSIPLSYDRFWNIAGRAGRALKDSFGIILFPRTNAASENELGRYLRGEAAEIASQLAEIVVAVDRFGPELGNDAIERFPQVAAFLQYLSHAVRVAGELGISDEIDDLLRGSLGYYQAERSAPGVRERLTEICRQYVARVSGNRGLLDLADATGFATPTVLRLINRRDRDQPEFRSPTRWQTDRIFGDDIAPLTKRVAAVADVPGLRLGLDDTGRFNPRRVAEITRDWVNGMSVEAITQKYSGEGDDPTRISRYVFSTLSSQLSWGLAAFESVCFAGADEWQNTEIPYIPSFVYYGVRSKEAVWMRMAGVPRTLAERFGNSWRDGATEAPASFTELRSWVRDSAARMDFSDLDISRQDIGVVLDTLVASR